MKIPRMVDAMNEIDDELVSWADGYRRATKVNRLAREPVWKVCECVFAFVLIIGMVCFWSPDSKKSVSPFVLTAYAFSQDGGASANVLEQGRQVPISTFETTGGLMGFVISCNKIDDDALSSVAIISNGTYQDGIDEIVGIATDPNQNYYIYIPGENEVAPYTLPLFLTDEDANIVCQYKIMVIQVDNSYYAELVEEGVMERTTK